MKKFLCLIAIVIASCCNILFAEQNSTTSTNPTQSADNSATANSKQSLLVWYLPGFLSCDDKQEIILEKLSHIYRNGDISNYPWFDTKKYDKKDENDAFTDPIWRPAVKLADNTAIELSKKIQALPKEKQQRLVLVGHSLGCRIILKAMYDLNQKGIKIKQAILLGAAINNNDAIIPEAINASIDTVYSFVNPTDRYLLASFADPQQDGVNRAMLGKGYFDYLDSQKFCEIQIESTKSHESRIYCEMFVRCTAHNTLKQNCIIVPQSDNIIPFWIENDTCIWNTKQSYHGWTLRSNYKNEFAIADDLLLCRAKGSQKAMEEAFTKVKKQLDAGVSDGERVSNDDFSHIEVPQDEIVPKNSMGSSKELNWNTRKEYQGWRLQYNSQDNKWRILDPSSHCRALGSAVKMDASFDKIKFQLRHHDNETK